jgi:hypothetical protein
VARSRIDETVEPVGYLLFVELLMLPWPE